MECYSQVFSTVALGGNPYPGKPVQFVTISAAKIAYREFIADCDTFGYGQPDAAWVWLGNIDEVDYHNGVWLYPEFAYLVLECGPKNGVKITYM